MVQSRLPIFESLGMKDCVKNVLKWIESLVNPLFCYIFALEIKVNGREVDSADFCKSFIDCIETNLKNYASETVRELFNEKIDSIRNELETLESKTQAMNSVLNWDDIWEQKFLKKD